MKIGDTVYFHTLKDHVDNYSGKILEDLGDMVIVENQGCRIYIKKDRVTKDLKQLLEIAFD